MVDTSDKRKNGNYQVSENALGTVIEGFDLSRHLSSDDIQHIKSMWYEHLVIVFRGQNLSDDDLVRFAHSFGELHSADGAEYGGKPEELHDAIELISNIEHEGRPIGALGADEATWHTDMSMYEIPAAATILYADEIPSKGGNTRFTNLYVAYETLPHSLRDSVESRRSIHDHAYLASGGVRPGFEAVTDKSKGPGARHPVIRTHPVTGRKALYLGRFGNGYIEGYSVEESDNLIKQLWNHMTRPDFIWEHEWRVGDLIMWDNRCVAHARGSFDPTERRLLRRITVKGEIPA